MYAYVYMMLPNNIWSQLEPSFLPLDRTYYKKNDYFFNVTECLLHAAVGTIASRLCLNIAVLQTHENLLARRFC